LLRIIIVVVISINDLLNVIDIVLVMVLLGVLLGFFFNFGKRSLDGVALSIEELSVVNDSV